MSWLCPACKKLIGEKAHEPDCGLARKLREAVSKASTWEEAWAAFKALCAEYGGYKI